MKNKGYVVILDAIIALIFVLFVFTTFIAVYEPMFTKTSTTSFKDLHYLSEDVLDVLNKQGILDEIGTEWASANGSVTSEHWSNATNISKENLEKLIPKNRGYRLVIDDTNVIYDSNSDPDSDRPPESGAITTTHSTRLLVGYGSGLPTRGHVARAFLTNIKEKTTSSYAYFGGFEGQGNITKIITLPDSLDNVINAYIEVSAGTNLNLFINGNPCGSFIPTTWNMTANIKENLTCLSNFQKGNNTLNIEFINDNISKQYIGGGFIRVTYNTSEMDTEKDSGVMYYNFPGIDGLINLYSSFYIPETLNSMEIFLKFFNNYTTYFTIGDKEVFNSPGINETQMVILKDANLTMLNYASLSRETIPIRLGIRNISGEEVTGNVDVILITDVSGSMQWRLDSNNATNKVITNCSNPQLYDPDTRRISLAKCLDKEFVNIILNTTGNKVGLVSFDTVAEADGLSPHPLSNDNNSLINHINNYPNAPSGGTCVCCAINKAIELLSGLGQGTPVTLTPSVESPHPYPNNLQPPGSGVWTINGPANATKMRVHFTRIQTERNYDYLWVTDSNGNHVTLPGWESNERPNEIDTNFNILNYWSEWGNGSTIRINLETDNSVRRYGFMVDRYEYVTVENVSGKQRYIIVMTDGITGYHCGNCVYNGGCNCTGGCTATTGTQDCHLAPCCSGNAVDCSGAQCDIAINDAICSAQRARTEVDAIVYSIGFGPVSTGCTNANRTMQGIANCGNGSYHGSANASELKDIYRGIAQEIIESAYEAQTVTIIGNVTRSILYPESYIRFTYTPSNLSVYGEITLTQDTERFNDVKTCTGILFVPEISRVVDAKVTSYSAEYWTDYLNVSNSYGSTIAYTLKDGHLGSDYTLIGDPYIVQIPDPISNLIPGENNSLGIRTGNNPNEDTGCSPDNRAIYTIRLNGRVGYGNVFFEKNGCKWTIQFEDNSNITEMIPDDYNGTKECYYTPENISYNENDAIDDAIFRLLQKLDANGNRKIDIKFDSSMIEFSFSRAGGVRSLWGPITIKLIIWM